MAIQLTSEQEHRIQALIDAGAYPSAKEALDAAVAAVEIAAAPGFEGTAEELNELILEGLNSGQPIEADASFWSRLREKTDAMAREHMDRRT